MAEYVRIKDVAQIAGVSVATVDRVLHNRGKISEKALKKVMDALEQTGYKLNLIASTLGSHKNYKIAALLPDPALDDYWNQSGAGIHRAGEDWSQYHVRIESFYFKMNDIDSFKEAVSKVVEYQPDGVLIAPTFYRESVEFLSGLKVGNIPYVLFNTNIPESEPLSFIGQDLYNSGRVVGQILSTSLKSAGNIAIVHVYEQVENAIHLKEKERGFRDFFADKGLCDFKISSYDFSKYSDSDFGREFISVLEKENISAVFVSTSKGTYLTASVLDKYRKKDILLVGYDLLKDNIQYMYEGTIHYLINQNPRKQSVMGISYLANYLLFKKQPPLTELFPLEVIMRENLKSYLNSGLNY